MGGKISPSMMCCDLCELKPTLEQFELLGIEYLHIDIMDGVYVPNYTLGTDYVRMLRGCTDIPMDLHLMIMNPEAKLDWFDIRPGDYVSVHYESTLHIHRAIQKIKEKGAKAMLAINPGTPAACVGELADELDGVLVMTVDPGFAGQTMVPQTLKKLAELKKWLKKSGHENLEVEVDGNVSYENAKKMRESGADIFVAGTSSIFTKQASLEQSIRRLRDVIA